MTQPTQETAGERIAAIDIGSNSVRLVVAQVLPTGGYKVLDEERENTRLASSLDATGMLDEEAVTASVAALKHFLSIAKGHEVTQLRAIATSAVREAENGSQFCERVQNELGLEIEVISAQEEARFAYSSVARAFDVSERDVAIADIGGGSTEIVLASSGLIDQIYCTRLGAVRVAEACKATGQLSDRKLRRLQQFVDRELKRTIRKLPFVPSMLFGAGGTFTAIAAIAIARDGIKDQPISGYRLSRAAVRHLVADLAHRDLEDRAKVPGLNPRRADIIVAGLVVVERIMRYLQINTLQVHSRGVRDGLLLAMIQQLPAQQITDQHLTTGDQRLAVEQFASRCGVDLPHAQQVARLAGSLLEQLAEPLNLSLDDVNLIESAALLANVGYLINFEKHHKHSYHLILNSELPGFERNELRLLANIARYHRGASPKQKHQPFRELEHSEQQRVAKLAAILRLALALDRTHSQQVEKVVAKVFDDRVEFRVSAKGSAEVDLWAARRKVALFEKVFRRAVVFMPTE